MTVSLSTECTKQRKKAFTAEPDYKNNASLNRKDQPQRSLEQLSFLNKLFLLSLLDDYARDDVAHERIYSTSRPVKSQPINPQLDVPKPSN